MMIMSSRAFVLTSIFAALIHVSWAQTCSDHTFSSNRAFSSCRDLPFLGARLHWTYLTSTKTIQIAYRAAQSFSGWVAWGINPMRASMAGTQAIVAVRNPNGTVNADTTSINGYTPSMKPGAVRFPVSNLSAEYSNGEMTIFALVGPLENVTGVNHVWQAGPVTNGIPGSHAVSGPNIQSLGKINFAQE